MGSKRDALFMTMYLSTNYDYLAPDGSEIRLLPDMRGGGLAHCMLPPHHTSAAVTHRTVEEIWYFLGGRGEVWRKHDTGVEIVAVHPGMSVTIPLGVHFQFRSIGDEPLTFLIVTMPPWPGAEEAIEVPGQWSNSSA